MKIKQAHIEIGTPEVQQLLQKELKDTAEIVIKDIFIHPGQFQLFLRIRLPLLGEHNLMVNIIPGSVDGGIEIDLTIKGFGKLGERAIILLLEKTGGRKLGLIRKEDCFFLPSSRFLASLGLTGDLIIDKLVCSQDKIELSIRGDIEGVFL